MEAKLNNQTVFVGNVRDFALARKMLADELELSEQDFEIVSSPKELVASARQQIRQTAGDTDSLLGTTSDTVHLLLYELGQLLPALSNAQSLAEVRAAAAPLAATLGAFAQSVDESSIRLPYQNKSTDVLDDVASRATEVAQVLAEHTADSAAAASDESSPTAPATDI